jgi:hypothetical protein
MSATLFGRVSSGGLPATMAVVEVHNSAGDVVDQVQVDSEGAFTYHLCPGDWHLEAWDSAGNRGAADVTLDEGEARIELEIGPPA